MNSTLYFTQSCLGCLLPYFWNSHLAFLICNLYFNLYSFLSFMADHFTHLHSTGTCMLSIFQKVQISPLETPWVELSFQKTQGGQSFPSSTRQFSHRMYMYSTLGNRGREYICCRSDLSIKYILFRALNNLLAKKVINRLLQTHSHSQTPILKMTSSKAIFYISLFTQQNLHWPFPICQELCLAEGARMVPLLKGSLLRIKTLRKRESYNVS